MKKRELIAYFAGIIDGEAYVGIKKSTYGMRKREDTKSPIYSERVQIRMGNKNILTLFKKTFGGHLRIEPRIYQSKSGFKSRKIMTLYLATDKIASEIIKAVYPFLIEKKIQARCILELRKSKESKEARWRGGRTQRRVMSPKVLNKREFLYQQIKAIHNS